MYKHEKIICTSCLFHLPKTGFSDMANNPVSEIFAGRVNLHSASAYLFFRKTGSVQKLIHRLKYKGDKEVGEYLSKLFGEELMKSPLFSTATCVIPVPLHPKKLKKRGYNQAEVVADGIAAGMGICVNCKTLVRATFTETQTRKARFNRWQNVEGIFQIKSPEELENQHVILCDDVVTTGSTLEACVNALQQIRNIKVSIASLAVASNI
ncbi:MAG: ComF family protein [Bacteroidetes bacterium]|nr:ComF family protein [Bacteroidota bacterium]